MNSWSKISTLSLVVLVALITMLIAPEAGPWLRAQSPQAAPTPQTASCPTPTVYPLTITDERGQQITSPRRPERIVSGAALFTQILFDIGAGSRVVGVTASPDNPAQAQELPQVGSSFQPNVEQIIALRPDVVFDVVSQARDRLESAGLVVITPIGFVTHLSDILDIADTVGRVVDGCLQAGQLIGRISEEVVRLESRVLDLDRVEAAFIYASQPSPPFFAAGRGAIESELLARAGGGNLFADIQGVQQIGLESLLDRDPDFIFTDPSQVVNFAKNPVLADLKAVKLGQVIGIKASLVTSTRVAQALETMARTLHQAAFSQEGPK